jgi:hypothetical protein
MLTRDIFGLSIPDAGPAFTAALALHIASGITAVISGTLAATAKKQPGRHPRAGHVYLWALGAIVVTATVMSAFRWQQDAHLFAIAVAAGILGAYGYVARRAHRPGWVTHHAIGMAGSFTVVLIGFYVDNGPSLPLWKALPHITYWLLPAVAGVSLTWLALRRFAKPRVSPRPTQR